MNEKSQKILTSEFWAQQRIFIIFSIEVGKIPEYNKSSWIHLHVITVFQWPWFISGISDLVTVEFRQNNERVGRPILTEERMLTLVREVTNTDRRSTVGDTTEMCDLNEDHRAVYFQSGCPDLEVYSVCWWNYFKKNPDLQKRQHLNFASRCQKSCSPWCFWTWHSVINNEDIWLKFWIKIGIRMGKTAIVLIGFVTVSVPNFSCCLRTFRTAFVIRLSTPQPQSVHQISQIPQIVFNLSC